MRIMRKKSAPKTKELVTFLKSEIDQKKLKVGDVLYTNDDKKMLVPDGFHKPTAQGILYTSVRAGILERVGRGQAIVTEKLQDFSVRKILGILKRRKWTENQRKKGENKKLRHRRPRQKMPVSMPTGESLSPVEEKKVIATLIKEVISTLIDECSLEELMSATYAKAVKMREEEISEKSSSLVRLKEDMKRLNLITVTA